MIPGLPRNTPLAADHYETSSRRQYGSAEAKARAAAEAARAEAKGAAAGKGAARPAHRLGHGREGDRSYRTTGIGSRHEEGRDASAPPPRPPSPAAPALQETHIKVGAGAGAEGWSTSHHDMFVDRGSGVVASASSRAELVRTSFTLGSAAPEYSTTASSSRHYRALPESTGSGAGAAGAGEAHVPDAAEMKALLGASHIDFGCRGSAGAPDPAEQYRTQSGSDYAPHPAQRREAVGSRAELARSHLHIGGGAVAGAAAPADRYTSSNAASAFYRPLAPPADPEAAAAARAAGPRAPSLDPTAHSRTSFSLGHGRTEGAEALHGPQRRNELAACGPGSEPAAVEASGSRAALMRTSLCLGTEPTPYATSHGDQFVERAPSRSGAAGSSVSLQRTTMVLGTDEAPAAERYATDSRDALARSAAAASSGGGVRRCSGSIKALMSSSVTLGARPDAAAGSHARQSLGQTVAMAAEARASGQGRREKAGSRTGLNAHSVHFGHESTPYATTAGDAFVPRDSARAAAASSRAALCATSLHIGSPNVRLTYETAANADYGGGAGGSVPGRR